MTLVVAEPASHGEHQSLKVAPTDGHVGIGAQEVGLAGWASPDDRRPEQQRQAHERSREDGKVVGHWAMALLHRGH